MQQLPRRLQSIDIFRAVTMFFMIFVNDVDGVTKIPEWIKHVDEHTDGLGFADTIFPAFLFIVGLSVPFALSKRMQSNESKSSIAIHILLRSLALIVMGFFHVNLENYSDAALLPEPVFEIIIILAFFLIWLDYKPSFDKTKAYLLQATGVLILIVLAFLYKGESESHNIVGMRPQWWGILGLIGWGYLTCALFYLFTNGKLPAQIIALLIFLIYNIVSQTTLLDSLSPILQYCWFLGGGSEIALIMAGIVISLLYRKYMHEKRKNFFPMLLLIAFAMFAFGFGTRPIGGISKINATPAWVGICTGISIVVFALLIFIADVKGKAALFAAIKPAGTSTLTCYLLPYFLYSFMSLFNVYYPQFFNEGAGGIVRSFAVAFIVIFITRFLEKKHLRLKI